MCEPGAQGASGGSPHVSNAGPAQFTLYCRLKGALATRSLRCTAPNLALHRADVRAAGNKPDFAHAMPPQAAREAYASLLARLRSAYRPEAVQDGVFGAMMQVELVNDGPVTIVLDSQAKE